jgi:hypothetical protein
MVVVPKLVVGEGKVPEEDLLAEELLRQAAQLVPRQADTLQLTVPRYTTPHYHHFYYYSNYYYLSVCISCKTYR